MTRLRLILVTQLCVLAIAVACGSANNNGGIGSNNTANVGGQIASIVGGNGYQNAGKNSTAGVPSNGGVNSNNGGVNSSAGSGAAGDGTSGSNSQAGNSSGTGSSGNTTNGGSGSFGGTGNVGGDYFNLGGDGQGVGGGSTVNVMITGGSGNTTDVATGGSGSTVDIATGGGWTIDVATGGGSSIDMATGGGSSIDMATGGGATIDLGTGGGSSTDIPNCIATDLNNVNVYVITDLNNPSTTVSDCEGNMYVGGNFYSATGYSIGGKNGVAGDPCAQYSLVVGGNVSGAMVNNGKAVAGGTIANSQDPQCGGVVRVAQSQLPVDFATLTAEFQNLSTALAQLPTSTGATVTRDAGGALVLTGTDPVQNVFNIDGSQLGTLTIDVPLTSIVIVNVTGTAINWPGGAMTLPGARGGVNGDYLFASNVIWNFPQATTFYMNGLAIDGTILAPWATFDASGAGHVAGQVIVYAMTTGLSIEFHPYYFSACITWPKAS